MNCQAVVRRHWLFFFFLRGGEDSERGGTKFSAGVTVTAPTTMHAEERQHECYLASNQAQPLLIWWRRDLGLGASKNKRALIGQFKGKIPSRREVPHPRDGAPQPQSGGVTCNQGRRKRHVDPSFVESRLLLCARRFLSPNEKNVFHSFRPGWMRQNAGQKVFTRTRIYLSSSLLEDPPSVLFFFFFFFFFQKRKEHNSIAL